MPTLYLIDAHAYLHRAYHALPPMNTSRGEPVNAIYGFLRMINKIIRQHKPDYMAVCFDTAAPTFRHKALPTYKATRKETDQALISQFPIARDAVEAMGLARFEQDGYEADDLIAHLSRAGVKQGWDVVIVSGDKDALQLVNERVRVLNEFKDIVFDEDKVKEVWGVAPKQIPEVLALMGDTSDNVPGVKGIGEKTAVKLIQEHGTLEALLEAAPKLKGNVSTLLVSDAEMARKSRELVSLGADVPHLLVDWDSCRVQAPKAETFVPFLQRMEFQAMLKEVLPAQAVDTSKRDYGVLLTEKDLADWVAKAKTAERLAVDVETTGIDALSVHLVGIALSTQPNSARYIPLRHGGLGEPAQVSLDVAQKHLVPLFQGKPALYGHNLKYDSLVLKRHGFPLGKLTCDTMVASYVLNPSRNSHGLKDLVLELVGESMTPIEELIGKGAKQTTMDTVPIEKAAPYACADVDMTLRLADRLEPRIRELGLSKLFYELEMPLVSILGEMEQKGIRIGRSYLQEFGKQLNERIAALEKTIHDLAGEQFNVNSTKQLAVILFEKLKLPVVRKTKTGYSTDEEVLQKLSAHHALPQTLLEYRELQKLYSTYIDSLLEAAGEDERVHTSFNQTVAATGRLSSSNPNLQNIPIRTENGRLIRKAFIPADGTRLLSADYSQIDLRMLAHISQDTAMCKAFRAGEDIHTATAVEIFGIKPEDVNAEMRRVAKSINFGIVYGISAFGLSQQLGIAMDVAQGHIKRYFERYPGVKNWIDQILETARREGSVRTLLGRVRFLPEINSGNGAVRGFAERTAMNTPIQGTSADVIKVAMLHLSEARQAGQWVGDMLLQVHDELVFEIPEKEFETSSLVIKKIMENAVALDIPVVVDLKTGPNWTEMKKI